MGAVVLAHGPPLALAQVRSPELPALLATCVFGEPHPLGRSGLALGSGLDRHAHDSVLILDQHGSPPLSCGGEQPPRTRDRLLLPFSIKRLTLSKSGLPSRHKGRFRVT